VGTAKKLFLPLKKLGSDGRIFEDKERSALQERLFRSAAPH
jgi:hypothetical protein